MKLSSLAFLSMLAMTAATHADDLTLIDNGSARIAIFAPKRVVEAPDFKEGRKLWRDANPEVLPTRLRDSVRDLAHYLEVMSGAKVDIVTGAPPAGDKRIPILIAELADAKFGKIKADTRFKQSCRMVVAPDGVGLQGETDLGASYAVYTLLDRLGCRWYIPSKTGEVIPQSKTVKLAICDDTIEPYTHYRGLWYIDDDYGRRNRCGGFVISAGHALEGYVSKEQREEHPEWRGVTNGKPHKRRLRWSRPGVVEALADGIIEKFAERPNTVSISLSPDDGLAYDQSEDTKLDAGDWDPSIQANSITDRQVWLCNGVIKRVEKKMPGILYGMLAYGQSTRPPIREKPHPDLVPQFAPITYRRVHPMTYDGVPGNEAIRSAIRGWAKVSPMISYYFYGWILADPAQPSPFITKWGEDLKFIYKYGNCRFWQPETMPTFDTTMHALYMGLRMAWDPTQSPKAIVDELHEKYYGKAGAEMAAYWHYIDHTWLDTAEYSGAGFGHMLRWPKDKIAEARRLMDAAIAVKASPVVRERIKINDIGLQLFELFMKLRQDLAAGRFDTIDKDGQRYYDWAMELAETYRPQYCFGWVYHKRNTNKTYYAAYFKVFYKNTYDDAGRIAREGNILAPSPVRKWKFAIDPDKVGETEGWENPTFNDDSWRTIDTSLDTLSSLGRHNYLGSMWYRTNVTLGDLPKGKRAMVWIGANDGTLKVFVNGKLAQCIGKEGKLTETHDGFCKPASFDATGLLKKGDNQITIHGVRHFINELGTPAVLTTPIMIYTEK